MTEAERSALTQIDTHAIFSTGTGGHADLVVGLIGAWGLRITGGSIRGDAT